MGRETGTYAIAAAELIPQILEILVRCRVSMFEPHGEAMRAAILALVEDGK